MPISAHAAFDKGAAYMGIKVHTIPVDPETRMVDLKRVARAINPNTIMVRLVLRSSLPPPAVCSVLTLRRSSWVPR